MKNEISVTLNDKVLTIYSITFKTYSKITETPTLNDGIIRKYTGGINNSYTLKGRILTGDLLSFAVFINSLTGQAVTLSIGSTQAAELTLTSGECSIGEEGLCEYTIILEEAD